MVLVGEGGRGNRDGRSFGRFPTFEKSDKNVLDTDGERIDWLVFDKSQDETNASSKSSPSLVSSVTFGFRRRPNNGWASLECGVAKEKLSSESEQIIFCRLNHYFV